MKYTRLFLCIYTLFTYHALYTADALAINRKQTAIGLLSIIDSEQKKLSESPDTKINPYSILLEILKTASSLKKPINKTELSCLLFNEIIKKSIKDIMQQDGTLYPEAASIINNYTRIGENDSPYYIDIERLENRPDYLNSLPLSTIVLAPIEASSWQQRKNTKRNAK